MATIFPMTGTTTVTRTTVTCTRMRMSLLLRRMTVINNNNDTKSKNVYNTVFINLILILGVINDTNNPIKIRKQHYMENPEFIKFAKLTNIKDLLDEFFKPDGPATHFGLLSNFNILNELFGKLLSYNSGVAE